MLKKIESTANPAAAIDSSKYHAAYLLRSLEKDLQGPLQPIDLRFQL